MTSLETQWFFRLVGNYGKTPAERLVAVFAIVESLMQAPDIRAKLAREFPCNAHCLYGIEDLKAFLTELAIAARVANPAGLAGQLSILLQGAIAEELRNPDTGALREATNVARMMIEKSGKKPMLRNVGWMSAGGAAAALLLSLMGWQAVERAPAHAAAHAVALRTPQAMPAGVSPDEIDAVLALHEKIERGICRAPQLLALPPGQMTAYMNVVESRTPDDPAADRKNIREFLAWFDKIQSTECYDPPTNGHTAVTWKQG